MANHGAQLGISFITGTALNIHCQLAQDRLQLLKRVPPAPIAVSSNVSEHLDSEIPVPANCPKGFQDAAVVRHEFAWAQPLIKPGVAPLEQGCRL
jgi:hypothetical protein